MMRQAVDSREASLRAEAKSLRKTNAVCAALRSGIFAAVLCSAALALFSAAFAASTAFAVAFLVVDDRNASGVTKRT